MAKSKPHITISKPRLRTPGQVALSAIDRFSRNTAQGAGVDSDAWQRAIEDESRAFAQELIKAAVEVVINRVAGAKSGKAEAQRIASDITEALAEAAG